MCAALKFAMARFPTNKLKTLVLIECAGSGSGGMGLDHVEVSGEFPDDVCFTVTPPVDGWSPAARYRVEMSSGSGHSCHSYSFDVSDSDSGVPAVEIPMRVGSSGGLLSYGY